MAFLQGDDDQFAEVQDDNDGGDATTQGWLSAIRFGIRAFRIIRKCIPRMQAKMQKADEGDEDLAKDMLKRIANLQEEGGDGDVEAQFLRRIFRRVRKSVRRFLRRPMRIYRRIRKRYSRIRRMFGRMVRGYRKIMQGLCEELWLKIKKNTTKLRSIKEQ